MALSRFYSGNPPLPTTHIVLMAVIAAAMMAVSGLWEVFPSPEGPMGICLPSPNLWNITPVIGWSVNTFLLLLCAGAWIFLNKEFTLVKGIDQLTLAAFLMFVGSNPVCTDSLTTGSILLTVTVLCMAILFGTAHERNCTHQIFAIFTFLSVGSMYQYAFVLMMPVFFAGALMMKAMRAKEVVAMLLGIVAPYWVAVGLGLVELTAFHLPEIHFGFDSVVPVPKRVVLWINIGLSGLLAALFSFSNSMVMFAGNKETRARNNVITMFNVATLLFIIFNPANMAAYLPVFYLAFAVQVGNLFAYHNLPWRRTLLWSFAGLYTIGFILMLLL